MSSLFDWCRDVKTTFRLISFHNIQNLQYNERHALLRKQLLWLLKLTYVTNGRILLITWSILANFIVDIFIIYTSLQVVFDSTTMRISIRYLIRTTGIDNNSIDCCGLSVSIWCLYNWMSALLSDASVNCTKTAISQACQMWKDWWCLHHNCSGKVLVEK